MFRCSACMVLFFLTVSVVKGREPGLNAPPPTRAEDFKEKIHGVEIRDPYRWLEDRKSPETQAWIDQQSQYTQSILNKLPGREQLARRLGELIKIDAVGIPHERIGWFFFFKRRASQELPILYLRKGLAGNDEVLLDPHPMSPDHTTSVTLLNVSQDGKTLVYGVRQGGQDEVTVNLLDVATRRNLPDHLPKGRYFGGVALTPDKTRLYYARHSPAGTRVYYHTMGTDVSNDVEIFGKDYGPDTGVSASLSDDGRYLLIHVFHGSAGDRSEVYFQRLEEKGPIVPIVNDLEARFSGEIGGDQLYLHTNWNAPNGRILAVDLKHSERDHWRVIVPESDAAMQGFSLAGGKLFVNYLKNVRSILRIFDPDGRPVRDINPPVIGTLGAASSRWKSKDAFFAFESFHIPETIYHYNILSGAQEVWARPSVPVKSDDLEVKQVWYESQDKTKVPMFLLHRKGIKLDGSHPTLLTGYGGFNVSETPAFAARAVLWAERGGVFAVPNLRGGGEFGEEWHRAGMHDKKQNVFDDFIAAAQWLVANRYTSPSKLAISGRSNGGLLMGASITQRPDLFQAVVCGYPLLDMLRYHKFLIAQLWVSEYGSADEASQFPYIYAYSPYHHVKPGTKYPAVLFVTGDGDTRVDPLHARKMAAELQAATASDRPVLLHYDVKAGHTSAAPVSKQIEDLVDELSFLFWQLRAE